MLHSIWPDHHRSCGLTCFEKIQHSVTSAILLASIGMQAAQWWLATREVKAVAAGPNCRSESWTSASMPCYCQSVVASVRKFVQVVNSEMAAHACIDCTYWACLLIAHSLPTVCLVVAACGCNDPAAQQAPTSH